MIKRIAGGSARTPQELGRLLDYVAGEEGVESTWCNLAGYERDFDPGSTAKVAKGRSSTWRGAPKRGHSDHIVLSIPRGTAVAQAEAIAREWGQEVFRSGDCGDVWHHVAALHSDTDHVHAHFVVDKHGIEVGQFLSICRYCRWRRGERRDRYQFPHTIGWGAWHLSCCPQTRTALDAGYLIARRRRCRRPDRGCPGRDGCGGS